jgi:hypothetical protein
MKPDISQTGIRLSQWIMTKRNDLRPIDSQIIQGFYSLSHTHTSIPQAVMARFFLGDTELYRAWGFSDEEHCSFHSIFLDSTPEAIPGCPPVTVIHKDGASSLSLGTRYPLLPIIIVS